MSDKRTALEYLIENKISYEESLDVKHGYGIRAQAELAYLRECERLLKVARRELAGTMFVTYETGGRPFREIVDELFASVYAEAK